MDISMDIHRKPVDMDMGMDGKFHIHGKPGPDTHTHTHTLFTRQTSCLNCSQMRGGMSPGNGQGVEMQADPATNTPVFHET